MKKLLAIVLLSAAATTTAITADRTESARQNSSGAVIVANDLVSTQSAHRSTGLRASTGSSAPLFTRLFTAEEGAGRWDPCKVVRWKMNTEGYTKKRFGQVVKALRQLRKATGLTIRYDGPTDDADIATLEPGVITVSFVPASEMPKDVIGTAGVGLDWPDQGGGISRADIRIALHAGYTPKYGYVPVLIHELGHAVGLGHSSDERSAMFAYENGAYRYNKNDLAGLKTVGASNGCVVAPSNPISESPETVPTDPTTVPPVPAAG